MDLDASLCPQVAALLRFITVYALVQLVAFGGQVIILLQLFDMDIGALARAKCLVL